MSAWHCYGLFHCFNPTKTRCLKNGLVIRTSSGMDWWSEPVREWIGDQNQFGNGLVIRTSSGMDWWSEPVREWIGDQNQFGNGLVIRTSSGMDWWSEPVREWIGDQNRFGNGLVIRTSLGMDWWSEPVREWIGDQNQFGNGLVIRTSSGMDWWSEPVREWIGDQNRFGNGLVIRTSSGMDWWSEPVWEWIGDQNQFGNGLVIRTSSGMDWWSEPVREWIGDQNQFGHFLSIDRRIRLRTKWPGYSTWFLNRFGTQPLHPLPICLWHDHPGVKVAEYRLLHAQTWEQHVWHLWSKEFMMARSGMYTVPYSSVWGSNTAHLAIQMLSGESFLHLSWPSIQCSFVYAVWQDIEDRNLLAGHISVLVGRYDHAQVSNVVMVSTWCQQVRCP